MGINEVKKEILDNARKEARKILAEAEKEKKAISDSIGGSLASTREKHDAEIKTSVSQYESAKLAEAESTVKKEKLAIERDLINEVFSKAEEKLSQLDSKKRQQHVMRLLAKKPAGFSRVYCSQKDLKSVKGAKQADILGGVILEDSTGETRIDMSYDVLLDEIKKEELNGVVDVLFS